jgi:LysM repeat protein
MRSTAVMAVFMAMFFLITTKVSQASEIIYIMKKGDSLSKIAYHNNISASQVYAENKRMIGKNPHRIFPGQKLVILKKTTAINKHAKKLLSKAGPVSSKNKLDIKQFKENPGLETQFAEEQVKKMIENTKPSEVEACNKDFKDLKTQCSEYLDWAKKTRNEKKGINDYYLAMNQERKVQLSNDRDDAAKTQIASNVAEQKKETMAIAQPPIVEQRNVDVQNSAKIFQPEELEIKKEDQQMKNKENSTENPLQPISQIDSFKKEVIKEIHQGIAKISVGIVGDADAADFKKELTDFDEDEDDDDDDELHCPAMAPHHISLTGNTEAELEPAAETIPTPVKSSEKKAPAQLDATVLLPSTFDVQALVSNLKKKYSYILTPINILLTLIVIGVAGCTYHRIFFSDRRRRFNAKGDVGFDVSRKSRKSEKEFVGKVFTEQGLEYFCVNQKGNGARGMKTLEELSDAVSQIMGKGYRHRIVFDFLPDIKKDGNLWEFTKDNVMMLNEDERMLLTSFINA